MRKHYKLISAIICVLLCVCMIVFGVYAASHALVSLDSSVTFNPSTAKLKVFGGVSGCKENNTRDSLQYYACNYKTSPQDGNYKYDEETDTAVFGDWIFSDSNDKINFDDNYVETATKKNPNPIYFYVQLTNYVERNVSYSITVFGGNPNVAINYGYYLKSNDELLKDSAAETYNTCVNSGFFDITATEKNVMNFANKIPTFNYDVFQVDQSGEGNLYSKAFPSGNGSDNSSLATTMIVIRLELLNAEENLTDFNFKFVISAN